jgi:hypothetical protein
MKVILGKRNEPLINSCIVSAQQNGHDVYVEMHHSNANLDEFYIDILGETLYRAPDAKFIFVPSGTYVFKDNQIFFAGESS